MHGRGTPNSCSVRVSECCLHRQHLADPRTHITRSMQSTARKAMDKLMNVVMELRKVFISIQLRVQARHAYMHGTSTGM